MPVCSYCRKDVAPDADFCPGCGGKSKHKTATEDYLERTDPRMLILVLICWGITAYSISQLLQAGGIMTDPDEANGLGIALGFFAGGALAGALTFWNSGREWWYSHPSDPADKTNTK